MNWFNKAYLGLALSVSVIVMANSYAGFVSFHIEAQHNQELKKIAQQQSLAKQIEHIDQKLIQLQGTLTTFSSTYSQYQQQFNRVKCYSGAYAEIARFARDHNIHLDKMEQTGISFQAPQEESKQADKDLSWHKTQVVFNLTGMWQDYIHFRNKLMQNECLISVVLERIRATNKTEQIQARIQVSVLRLQHHLSKLPKQVVGTS